MDNFPECMVSVTVVKSSFFFNHYDPKQGSTATTMQGLTGCGRIRTRNIRNEEKEKGSSNRTVGRD